MIVLLLGLVTATADAGVGGYGYSGERSVVGMMRTHVAGGGQTLVELARDYGLGYEEMVEANPAVDPWWLEAGAEILLPETWVLPPGPREGVVVNLAELRLYHFDTVGGVSMVRSYPVGIGREGFETPPGEFSVVMVIKDPSWYVPPSIRRERPELPAVVPPGEDNPLGDYAVMLTGGEYFIHGTHRPYGVGRRVSHGCIRMYSEHVGQLVEGLRPGTRVRIISEPVKAGVGRDGDVYVEVHGAGLGADELRGHAMRALGEAGLMGMVEPGAMDAAIAGRLGVPVRVGMAVLREARQ